jgi:type I restriction enzyme S subunit
VREGPFPLASLAECGVSLYDCEHATPPDEYEGYPYLAIPNLKGGRVDLKDVRRISRTQLAKWNRRVTPQGGDIIMTRRGRVGDTAVVPDGLECTIGQNLVILRSESGRIDQAFLRWALRGPLYDAEVQRLLNVGAVFDSLNCSDIPKISIPVPPMAEQRAIAGVLGALDDKIESNRRAINQLEKLFMLECELLLAGTDPVAVERMADLAELALGGTPSRAKPEFWTEGEIPWINSGCLHERPVLTPADRITRLGLERSATKMIPAGATVVAITGATLGVVSRLGMACAINQSVVAISAADPQLNTYLHFWMRSNISALVSSATGAAQQHVNKSNFEELQVDIPAASVLASIGERRGLLDHEVALARESQTLTMLRDALLPELLSGRLRVRNAEQVLSEAL